MTELGIYYCYAYRKDGSAYDTERFQGTPIKASVDAQHWADDRIQTGVYSKVDVRDALGRLIYSR